MQMALKTLFSHHSSDNSKINGSFRTIKPPKLKKKPKAELFGLLFPILGWNLSTITRIINDKRSNILIPTLEEQDSHPSKDMMVKFTSKSTAPPILAVDHFAPPPRIFPMQLRHFNLPWWLPSWDELQVHAPILHAVVEGEVEQSVFSFLFSKETGKEGEFRTRSWFSAG